MLKLENAHYLLEIEPHFGCLVRLFDKRGGIELITEPRLAENFRLLLPLAEMRANYVLGTQQRLTAHEISGSTLKLVWAGPLTNERGSYALAVTIWIELAGEDVVFRCEVTNNTPHDLAEVWYGLVGGTTGFGAGEQAKATKCLIPMSATQWAAEPFREFGNGSPPNQGLGLTGPEYTWWYPGHMPMPWASFYHEGTRRGIYYACHDTDVRCKVFRMAMEPGIAEKREGGDWPRADEVGDLPLGVTLNWIYFPYTKPGETFVGGAVVLRGHEGGWQEAAATYRAWFETNFGLVDSRRDWLRRETSFLDAMFLLPEDNVNLTFRDIPAWAKTAAEHGIGSVMISGWQVGGHDRGYPEYAPDPRLGTWEELEAGVRACHEMGLRVYFFANVQTVDISTDWYRNELHQYETMDPFGAKYFVVGWGMGTVGARKGLTKTPLYELNPSHAEVRKILLGYFRKLAEIGADGIHLDKHFIHPLDFNPRLKVSPDRAMPQGMLLFLREMLEACRAVRPDFCVSFENNWDHLLTYSDVFWWGAAPSPLKVAFPQWVSTNSIPQPYSYNQVAQQSLNGLNILIGPANYQRDMNYPPMKALCKYIGEVTRIRNELFDYVSRGRWVDSHVKLFANRMPVLKVSGSFAASASAGWTVFENETNGKRAVVLANMSGAELEVNGLSLSRKASGECVIHAPFEKVREAKFPVTFRIPAERVVFVVER